MSNIVIYLDAQMAMRNLPSKRLRKRVEKRILELEENLESMVPLQIDSIYESGWNIYYVVEDGLLNILTLEPAGVVEG